MANFLISKGFPTPLGPTRTEKGVNFAFFSTDKESVSLLFFDSTHKLVQEIALDPSTQRTGSVWHVEVQDLPDSLSYGYRVKDKILLDPYAKAVNTTSVWAQDIEKLGHKKSHYRPLGCLPAAEGFDWEGDRPPSIPLQDLILYEMHIRGFTVHSSSQVGSKAGSYLGVIEKIPYLRDLGVNAIEIMPMQEFDELEYTGFNPHTKTRLCNYWGYSTVNFFAPMNRYASSGGPRTSIDEFKRMVKALHKEGIEVILDIVFNHTAENGEKGPILSYKGLANEVYYILEADQHYANYTGCGNTVKCNHPIVQELIIDCLRYWVTEMHVDGFRFDLASIFYRDTNGKPMPLSPIVEAISLDPILSGIKLFAEPWDAAGLYQVGSFDPQSKRWGEWNGNYRDTVRRFIKGTAGQKGKFATSLCGSQDLYSNRSPLSSVNYLTSHDGFSLADLVAYNKKHNMENGEHNRDGLNQNESWNCGHEGVAKDPKVIALRERQMRNFHLALMVSIGIPMLYMGDEYAHTKRGNNNTWCQDNELNWFLWDKLTNQGFFRYYRGLIRFRLHNPLLRRTDFLTPQDIVWHGVAPNQPLWDTDNHFLAYSLLDKEKKDALYIAFNAQNQSVKAELPHLQDGKCWHGIVNTAKAPPQDYVDETEAEPITENAIALLPYSAVLLVSH